MGEYKNLHLIAEDLGKSKLEDVLNACEFWNTKAKSVIIAEGLLQYLAPEAVRDLFQQCASVTGNGSRIAFTYTPTGPDGKPYAGPKTKLVLWTLKLTGEPWLWSISPEDIGSFIEGLGWKYTPELLESKEKHGVEFYCVARKD